MLKEAAITSVANRSVAAVHSAVVMAAATRLCDKSSAVVFPAQQFEKTWIVTRASEMPVVDQTAFHPPVC